MSQMPAKPAARQPGGVVFFDDETSARSVHAAHSGEEPVGIACTRLQQEYPATRTAFPHPVTNCATTLYAYRSSVPEETGDVGRLGDQDGPAPSPSCQDVAGGVLKAQCRSHLGKNTEPCFAAPRPKGAWTFSWSRQARLQRPMPAKFVCGSGERRRAARAVP